MESFIWYMSISGIFFFCCIACSYWFGDAVSRLLINLAVGRTFKYLNFCFLLLPFMKENNVKKKLRPFQCKNMSHGVNWKSSSLSLSVKHEAGLRKGICDDNCRIIGLFKTHVA